MRAESEFNPMVVSPAGAQGLMQLMPDLAAEMGVADAFDPRENIMGGAKYLRWLLDRNRGNIPLTLASYNAGPGGGVEVPEDPAVPRDPELREEDYRLPRRRETRSGGYRRIT